MSKALVCLPILNICVYLIWTFTLDLYNSKVDFEFGLVQLASQNQV